MEEALKILFVDDEPDLAPLITQKFRKHVRNGMLNLTFASDGVDALEKLDADPEIEIIVTDINMPRMDGLTLLSKLRELEQEQKAIVVTAYGDMENIRTAMNSGAFDFLTKPIDLSDLEVTLTNAREVVEKDRMARKIKAITDSHLTKEITDEILRNPDLLGGKRHEVSVLMSDLSGFTAMSERLEPERVVEVLNVYLGMMTDIILDYGGTIDEFIGDAILVIFGAPVRRDDHAERGVACAIAMQQAMADVNAEMERRGLPSLEMGIAVNTGEVVVGTIGSEKRAKYGVVGSPVNMTSRIQALAASGEVVTSTSTKEAIGSSLRLSDTRDVIMKGFAEPIDVHFVAGLDGGYNLEVPATTAEPINTMAEPMRCGYAVIDGKELDSDLLKAEMVRLSDTQAVLLTSTSVEERTDIKLTIPVSESETADVYAKVVAAERTSVGGPMLTIRFTSVPPAAEEVLERHRSVGSSPAS